MTRARVRGVVCRWRKVARDTYDGVLKGAVAAFVTYKILKPKKPLPLESKPFETRQSARAARARCRDGDCDAGTEHPYDADELEQVDGVFEALFAELHDDLFLGSEAWELSPDTERILRELSRAASSRARRPLFSLLQERGTAPRATFAEVCGLSQFRVSCLEIWRERERERAPRRRVASSVRKASFFFFLWRLLSTNVSGANGATRAADHASASACRVSRKRTKQALVLRLCARVLVCACVGVLCVVLPARRRR